MVFVKRPPNRKKEIPKSTMIIDVLWRKYSEPILAMSSCSSPRATRAMPQLEGLISMAASSRRSDQIMKPETMGMK